VCGNALILLTFLRVRAVPEVGAHRPDFHFEAADPNPVIAIEWSAMTDPNEIAALKSSFRGAVRTAESLASLSARVEALDAHGEIAAADLDDLARVTAAHAIASAALRGLVTTMLTRRGAPAASE
jgi:hypothetical protein